MHISNTGRGVVLREGRNVLMQHIVQPTDYQGQTVYRIHT